MIDNLVNTFITLLNNGTENLVSVALVIASFLAIIDLILALALDYPEEMVSTVKLVVQKFLGYAFTFIVVKAWIKIIDEVTKFLFSIGYLFFKNPPTGNGSIGFPMFDSIFDTFKLSLTNIYLDMTSGNISFAMSIAYLIVIIIGYFLAFIVIKEIIINTVTFRLAGALGVILFAGNNLGVLKSYAQRVISSLLGLAVNLAISVALTGVVLQALEDKAYVSGEPNIGNAIQYIFIVGLAALLVTQSNKFGNMLMNGNFGGRSGNAIVGSVVSTGLAVAAGVVSGGATNFVGMKGAITKAAAAQADGVGFKGVLKAAKSGFREGQDIARNTRVAKFGRRVNNGLRNVVGYATGQRSMTNIGRDVGGIFSTVGDQIMHDREDLEMKKDNLFVNDTGRVRDYAQTERFSKAWEKAMERYNSSTSPLEMPESKISKIKNAIKEFGKTYNDKDLREEIFERAKEKRKDINNLKEHTLNEMEKERFKGNRGNKNRKKVSDKFRKMREEKNEKKYSQKEDINSRKN